MKDGEVGRAAQLQKRQAMVDPANSVHDRLVAKEKRLEQ